jgi:hypothetical protein
VKSDNAPERRGSECETVDHPRTRQRLVDGRRVELPYTARAESFADATNLLTATAR